MNDDITTYEWSIKPFDRFPDKPTRLSAGKRLGLDVAVVDKDHEYGQKFAASDVSDLGLTPCRVQGADAKSLGELILAGSPGP